MENQKSTSYEQDRHNAENQSFIRDYQNPNYNPDLEKDDLDNTESHLYPNQNRNSKDDSKINPDQENDDLDNTDSHLYPNQNRNSLNSNSVNTLEEEDEEVEEDEDEDENDDDDFNKEDFEEEGDFQEKDIDYREKKERDSF